ncbi:integrase core domain-containing protein, partial [Klebsiella pneumoniae]
SMSRKGNCLDNAVMENFFGTLKSECFYLREFRSVSALRKAVEVKWSTKTGHRVRVFPVSVF